jgi:UDP-2,3-diacylglucosamine hydrolase
MLCPAGRGAYGNAGAWYLDRQYLVIDDESVSRWQWDRTGSANQLARVVYPGTR